MDEQSSSTIRVTGKLVKPLTSVPNGKGAFKFKVTKRIDDSFFINIRGLPKYDPNLVYQIDIESAQDLPGIFVVTNILACKQVGNDLKAIDQYYELLCFFNDKYLIRKTPDLVRLHRILSTGEGIQEFCFHDDYEKVSSTSEHSRAFMDARPCWSEADVTAVCKKYKWEMHPNLLNGISFYRRYCRQITNFGNYVYNTEEMSGPLMLGLNYLIEINIMTIPFCGIAMSKIHDDIEKKLGALLKNINIHIIHCPFYDSDTCFGPALQEFGATLPQESTVIFSANASTAEYLSSFYPYSNVLFPDSPNIGALYGPGKKRKLVSTILVDRANKIGPSHLLKIMKNFPECQDLYLIGDLDECTATGLRGGGTIMIELSKKAKSSTTWTPEVEKNIHQYHIDLRRRVISCANLVTSPGHTVSDIRDYITPISNPPPQFQILCSTFDEYRSLCVEYVTSQNRPCYVGQLDIGSSVWIPLFDVHGILKTVKTIQTKSCCRVTNLRSTQTIHPKENIYDVVLREMADLKYNTLVTTILPGHARIARTYCSKPVDFIVFVVGPKTNLREIVGSIKYCSSELLLVFQNEEDKERILSQNRMFNHPVPIRSYVSSRY